MTRDLEALHRKVREQVMNEAIEQPDGMRAYVAWTNEINAEVAKRMYRAGVEDAAKVCKDSTLAINGRELRKDILALIGKTK